MAAKEYAHALGQQLETCRDTEQRVQLARLLAATGSPDAQPYLLDAIAEEWDEDALQVMREALAELEARQG